MSEPVRLLSDIAQATTLAERLLRHAEDAVASRRSAEL
jgi:hypothetical protein